MKTCTKCKKELPLTAYFKRGDGNGYRSQCKVCHGTAKDVTCPVCGKTHNRGGIDRRSPICGECYPNYRKAYNLHAIAKYRANKKELAFDLTLDWVLKRLQKCPKTGQKFYLGEDNGTNISNRHPYSPSIDKINPHLGYTQDNCQVVCWWYNVTKQQFTEEEVLSLCKQIVAASNTLPVPNVDSPATTEKATT